MRGIVTLTFLILIAVSTLFAQTSPLSQAKTPNLSTLKLDWQVYPNPFYNTFTVSSLQKDLQIRVFTLEGEQVSSTILRHHDGAKVLYQTGMELSPGIYFVKVSAGEAYRCYKMMKI